MNYKTCIKCGECKDYSSFHRQATCAGGRRNICKVCACKISKNYYKENTEYHRAQCAEWARKNKEKVDRYQKTRMLKNRIAREKFEFLVEQRIKAQKLINTCVQEGKIVAPSSCQICGEEGKTRPHLSNLNDAYSTIWTCSGCYDYLGKRIINSRNLQG